MVSAAVGFALLPEPGCGWGLGMVFWLGLWPGRGPGRDGGWGFGLRVLELGWGGGWGGAEVDSVSHYGASASSWVKPKNI